MVSPSASMSIRHSVVTARLWRPDPSQNRSKPTAWSRLTNHWLRLRLSDHRRAMVMSISQSHRSTLVQNHLCWVTPRTLEAIHSGRVERRTRLHLQNLFIREKIGLHEPKRYQRIPKSVMDRQFLHYSWLLMAITEIRLRYR